jgi:hypothetical protein
MAQENHWLPGFNFNVEEWDAKGQTYETLRRTLALAALPFAAAITEKPAGRFMIRSRIRIVKRTRKAIGKSGAELDRRLALTNQQLQKLINRVPNGRPAGQRWTQRILGKPPTSRSP